MKRRRLFLCLCIPKDILQFYLLLYVLWCWCLFNYINIQLLLSLHWKNHILYTSVLNRRCAFNVVNGPSFEPTVNSFQFVRTQAFTGALN